MLRKIRVGLAVIGNVKTFVRLVRFAKVLPKAWQETEQTYGSCEQCDRPEQQQEH